MVSKSVTPTEAHTTTTSGINKKEANGKLTNDNKRYKNILPSKTMKGIWGKISEH